MRNCFISAVRSTRYVFMGNQSNSPVRSRFTCYVKVLAVLLVTISYVHFKIYFENDTIVVFEPWWVWELATEGVVRTAEPVSWEVADNNLIIKAINDGEGRRKYVPVHPAREGGVKVQPQRLSATVRKRLVTGDTSLLNEPVQLNGLKPQGDYKTILLLTRQKIVNLNIDKKKCGVQCKVTRDQTLTNQPSAVVVDHLLAESKKFPERSNTDQLYVWMNRDSPYTTYWDGYEQTSLDGTFNLTMTHRRDSDIYYPLHTTADILDEIRNNPFIPHHKMLLRLKSKFVSWRPKTCGSSKVSRMAFDIVYRLRVAGLEIDIGGGCPVTKDMSHRQNLISEKLKYKFYLALGHEWHCRDFISNEVWTNALLVGSVPVIWGPTNDDLAKQLPRGSYIHAEEFASAFDLVNYLQYLNRDDDAYHQYLTWRESPVEQLLPKDELERQYRSGLCQLCWELHDRTGGESTSVRSVNGWWYGGELETCSNPITVNQLERANFFRQYVTLNFEESFAVMSSGAVYHLTIFVILVCILVTYSYYLLAYFINDIWAFAQRVIQFFKRCKTKV